MTIKQLTYLLAVNHARSFSGAAKNLFVSQSVISLAIKDLEKELGFKIFDRTSKKIDTTEKGYLVLNEAKTIISNCENMKSISQLPTKNSFSIRTFDFSPIIDCFVQFSKKYDDIKKTHLSLKISEFNEIISGILNGDCDLGLLIFPHNAKHNRSYYLDEKLFTVETLTLQQMHIKLSKNHPALKCKNIFNALSNYKLVHFRNEHFYPNNEHEKLFIDFDNTIYLNDKIARHELVKHTNAYMIGMPQPIQFKKIYDFVEIPLANQFVEIVYFYKKEASPNEYRSHFIRLLNEIFTDSIFNTMNDIND